MKIVKVVFGALLGIALIGGLIWHVWARDAVAFANIATGFSAKQLCSCVFVAERSLESCKGDALSDLSRLTFEQGEDSVTASVLGGLVSNTARYQSGLGCALEVL